MLHLRKFHARGCTKKSITDVECSCPFTILGPDPRPGREGKVYKECLKAITDHALATIKLGERQRDLILRPDEVRNGGKSVVSGIEDFLETKKKISDDRQRKFKNVLADMAAYLKVVKEKTMLNRVEKTDLDLFVQSWSGAPRTRDQKREMVMEFWRWCWISRLIPFNPAVGLAQAVSARERQLMKDEEVRTFSDEQLKAILNAADNAEKILWREVAQEPDVAVKTRTFIHVMKWSALANVDVTTLGPEHIGRVIDGIAPINKKRIKTGKTAHTSIGVT